MKCIIRNFLLVIVVCTSCKSYSQGKRNEGNGSNNKAPMGVFKTDIPDHLYDIILGRPTDHSITISLLATVDMVGYFQYGLHKENLNLKTAVTNFIKGQTAFIDINNLKTNSRYYYQFVIAEKNKQINTLNYFQTQRAKTANFSFCIQADSHLDENTSPAVYERTLKNIAQDSVDFLVDLGDTWMTDKYRNDYKESLKQYIAQRYYFGTVCNSSSLFLTLGNHDGESSQQKKAQSTERMIDWSSTIRTQYYPNPFPNEFYSGNNQKEKTVGYVQNYYSWQWGDALFIVLDPFRFTNNNRNPWQRTLGEKQYQWLQKTLISSHATFKFVFIHNLVGGADNNGIARGGVEAAKFFEWGGLDTNGINAFGSNRPGWEAPIHQLLVANKVNAVFHGHDHFFAKQDLDGIVYQLVPQPGSFKYGNSRSPAEYGYASGKIMNNPGYVRIKIENGHAFVDYLQTSVDETHKNKELLYSYEFK